MGSKDESRITLDSFASPSQGNVDTHRTEDSERSRKHPWIVPTFSPRSSSWNRALNRLPSGWHDSNTYSRTSCPPQAVVPQWVTGELVPISSSLWPRGGVHTLDSFTSPSQGNIDTIRTNSHAHIHSHLRTM
ncbi:hypothetical protein CHARACLAT_016833 [Characodon lateralis]|uniref:Uncharacterized protein n=1 Tax=Characodon lateralis TaxID=208331 RepID=A0ABU7DVA1_9TELE|nr:hypothetical protein [Characodon lateralis]